jgi:hypothetical protein
VRLAPAGLVTNAPDKWTPESLASLASQGLAGSEVIVVEVRNVGRMAVSVEKVTAYLANGIGF